MYNLGLALRQDPDPDREWHQRNRIRKDRKEELQNNAIPYKFSILRRTSFFLSTAEILHICGIYLLVKHELFALEQYIA